MTVFTNGLTTEAFDHIPNYSYCAHPKRTERTDELLVQAFNLLNYSLRGLESWCESHRAKKFMDNLPTHLSVELFRKEVAGSEDEIQDEIFRPEEIKEYDINISVAAKGRGKGQFIIYEKGLTPAALFAGLKSGEYAFHGEHILASHLDYEIHREDQYRRIVAVFRTPKDGFDMKWKFGLA